MLARRYLPSAQGSWAPPAEVGFWEGLSDDGAGFGNRAGNDNATENQVGAFSLRVTDIFKRLSEWRRAAPAGGGHGAFRRPRRPIELVQFADWCRSKCCLSQILGGHAGFSYQPVEEGRAAEAQVWRGMARTWPTGTEP